MKKSIFNLVVALCAVMFTFSCDTAAPATETQIADTAKVVTVDTAVIAPTATAVAVDTTKK